MLIISVIVFQIFIFIGLIFGFRRIMTSNVSSATKHLEALSQDYNKKEREVNKRLEEAKRKSEQIIARATGEAEKQKAEILKEAEAERAKALKDARTQSEDIIRQADKSRQLLISELEERIAKQAIDKACELIQEALPEQFKQDAHSRWIEDLIRDGFGQMENLRVSEGTQEIRVVSAFSLNEEQRKDLSVKLKTLLKREVALKEEVDPRLVVGIIVSIGNLVLDGSLRNRVREQATSE